MDLGTSRFQSERLVENYKIVRDTIDRACSKSGRQPTDLTLVAVSKSVGPELIAESFDLGMRHFGENRPKIHAEKIGWLRENRPDILEDVTWHMIGHLQRNKVRLCLANADMVHSIDSLRLSEKISDVASDMGREIDVLAQLKVSQDELKHGTGLENSEELLSKISSLPGLNLVGLMGMASFTEDEKTIRSEFSSLRSAFDKFTGRYWTEKGVLSMGMSADYKWAIEEGATHLRVGSSLFDFS